MAEKINKLRELSSAELDRKLEDARKEYRNLRFQYATGELTDFTRLRHARRNVARLMTLLHERQQMAATSAASAATMEGEA